MIYCPRCGTANRDGSKFCNECAQPLSGKEGRRCPMCGTTNPLESIFCSECGARVTPLDKPTADDEEPALSSRQDAMPVRDVGESPEGWADGTSLQDEGAADRSDVPDWLKKLRTSMLSEEPERERSVEPRSTPTYGIPDKQGSPRDEDADEEESTPDWLTRLRATAQAASAAPSPPEPESPPVTDQRPREEDQPPSSDANELPDWLARLRDDLTPDRADAAAAPARHDAQLPADYPLGGPATDEGPTSQEPPDDVPDWLRGIEPPATSGHEESDESTGAFGREAEDSPLHRPGWLDLADGSLIQEDVGAGAEQAASGDESSEAHLPGWLFASEPDAAGAGDALDAGDAPAESEAEADGVLAGLRGVIPVELPVVAPPKAENIGSLLSSTPDAGGAGDTFAKVVGVQKQQPAPTERAGANTRMRIGCMILTLILVLALLVAVILLIQAIGRGYQTPVQWQDVPSMLKDLLPGSLGPR